MSCGTQNQQNLSHQSMAQVGWWLPLVPRLPLTPCTFGFVYLAKFSLIWESSGAVLSTEAALALG